MGRKFKNSLLIILFLGIFCNSKKLYAASNYESWELQSPKKNGIIKTGELLITVKLLDSVKIFKGSFQLLIDDNLITNFIKFSPNQISIIYTLPLKDGLHKLELHIKAFDVGFLTPIKSQFYVNKILPGSIDSPKVKKSFFELSGNIIGNYKVINMSGPGEALAQSPPYFRDVNIDVVARVGQVSFPFRYYNTSDEYFNPGIQSRNYLVFGARYKYFELLYGDQNPVFDRLVLTGIRITGYKFSITTPRFQMQIVDGTSQNAMEGIISRYHASDSTPPPANLIRDTVHKNRDSTYISTPGIYRRHLTAARFAFGNKMEGSNLGISLLRARDDTSSIKYGVNPSDNIVLGADESYVTNGNALRVNAGAALSFYTTDISKGAVSESSIDSFYGYRFGFNPATYKNLIVLNLTTLKPGEATTADYITAAFKSANKSKTTDNLLTLDYHYYGSSYISEGNPFTQNDLWTATLQDQLAFFNRKVTIFARYSYQENNVSKSDITTITTHLINGSIFIAPAPNLPQFNIVINDQIRKAPGAFENLGAVNDNSLNLTGSINYNLKLGTNTTGFNVSYTNSMRNDAINVFTSNDIQIIGGGVTETFNKLNLIIDAHYTMMTYSNTETPTAPLSNTYDGHIKYQLKKLKAYFGIGGSITASESTSLLGSSTSTRDLFNVLVGGQIFKGCQLDFEAGIAPYTDLSYSSNNYKENYALLRLSYNFDFKR